MMKLMISSKQTMQESLTTKDNGERSERKRDSKNLPADWNGWLGRHRKREGIVRRKFRKRMWEDA